jgi:hypothetical protein
MPSVPSGQVRIGERFPYPLWRAFDVGDVHIARQHRPHRSLNAAAPLKPLPELVDLHQHRVRRQARADGTINEYRLVA